MRGAGGKMKNGLTLTLAIIAIPFALAKAPEGQAPQLNYLSTAEIEPAAMLPPPVADGSQAQASELAELQALAKTRSEGRLAQARFDDLTISGAIFADAVPGFDVAKLPVTAKLLDSVKRESNTVSHTAKLWFDRKRPYEFDASLNVCSQHRGKNATYPSGHTTVGFAMGSILARLIPDSATKIMARADDYGRSRMICGVHYRSDVAAGQVIGTSVALALAHNPRFKAQMAAAKAELIAAGLTK